MSQGRIYGDFRQMSLKGGNMRLHPAKDGLVPFPDERGITRRDKGGNRLVDVVSPVTGYCTGVTSPLLSNGKSVITPSPSSGGKGDDFRYDAESARYYDLIRVHDSDPYGVVVRLVTDGDEALPCTRIRVVETVRPAMSGSPEKADEALSAEKAEKRAKAAQLREEQDAAIRAVCASVGYEGPVTREMRLAVLEMIAVEKSVSGGKA